MTTGNSKFIGKMDGLEYYNCKCGSTHTKAVKADLRRVLKAFRESLKK